MDAITLPCAVTLTKIAPRRTDDDNNVGSLKGIRDEVSKLIGIDDRDDRVTWMYFQEKGKPKYYGVRITVEWNSSNKGWRPGRAR